MTPSITRTTKTLEWPVRHLVERYACANRAAYWFLGTLPFGETVIDHITPRTRRPLWEKAEIFVQNMWAHSRSYVYPQGGWWAGVYVFRGASPDHQPVLFVDSALPRKSDPGYQAILKKMKTPSAYGTFHFTPDPDQTISRWIADVGEEYPNDFLLHHIACRVPDLDEAMKHMTQNGFSFQSVQTNTDKTLRQVFTKPEKVCDMLSAGTVFELIERHPSLPDDYFLEEQADGLMKDSVIR